MRPGDYLFPSRRHPGRGISTRQYARLVQQWIRSVGLDPAFYGTHSLRMTKAALIYGRTGNLRTVQLLLGHRRIESTVRYLGVESTTRCPLLSRRTCEARARLPVCHKRTSCRCARRAVSAGTLICPMPTSRS